MKPLTKKIAVVFLLGLICASLIPVLPVAHAESVPIDPGSIGDAGVTVKAPNNMNWAENIIFGLLTAVQYGIGKLSQITANQVRWMIDFGTTVMDFPVVKSGFEVTLSFVNLLFVIAVIIIAFKMILQVGGHDDKKLLYHIILAALLVNFSFVIAGFLLDISNVLTNFFIQDINGTTLMGAFNPQRFSEAFGTGGFASFWVAIAQIFFTIIIAGIILITISAVFIMAAIRTIIVAGLLLVMPLTWGLWIFPSHEMQSHFSKWWSAFIKYGVTYLPTLTFFLWLAITTAGNTKYWTGVTAKTGMDGFSTDLIGSLMQLTLIVGIVVFGLKASAEAGGIGADLGMSMAKKTGGWVGRNAVKGAINARIPGLGGDKTLRGLGKSSAGLLSSAITRSPLKYIPGAMGLANKASESAHYEHNIEEFMKNNLSHMSYEQARDYNPTTDIGRAAKLKYLASLDKTGDFINDEHGAFAGRGGDVMREMIQASARMNHKHGDGAMDIAEVKKAIEAAPTLAREVGRTIAEQIARMSPSKLAELHHSNFDTATHPEEAGELIAAIGNNAAAVKAIATNGTERTQADFRAGLKALNSGSLASPAGVTLAIQSLTKDLAKADEEIKRLVNIGAQSTSHADHAKLNTEKAKRQSAINNIQSQIATMPTGTPSQRARRIRVAGITNGQAVLSQVVTRDNGNIINTP